MKQLHNIILIMSIALIGVMGVSIILPILPRLAHIFELTPTEVGLIITCFSLPSALFTPVAGIIADLYGRKKILLLGLILFAIGGIGCALSTSFKGLLFCRAIQGLGAAPLGILYSTIIGDLYKEEERPKMMGIAGATISVGTAIYPALGGFVGEIHWTLPFWFSLLSLPVAIIALIYPYHYKGTKTSIKDYTKISGKLIFHSHAIGLLSITFLCFSILYGPILTYFPLIANLLYQASPVQIGITFSIACLGTATIAINLAQLSKIYSHKKLLIIAASCYFISQGLVIIIPLQSQNIWLLTLPIFVLGIAQGISFPLVNSHITSLAPSSNRAIVMAINSTFMRLSQSISPIVFGIGWSFLGWIGPFIFGLFTSIILAILIMKVFSRDNPISPIFDN